MFIRMTKALLALGMMTAAGSSGAFYLVGSGNLPNTGYCGQVFYGSWPNGVTATGVMTHTMSACEQQLNAIVANGGYTAVEACHLCKQRFDDLVPTEYVLPRHVVEGFLDGTRRLREEYRIEEYERAQQELQRSFWPERKP